MGLGGRKRTGGGCFPSKRGQTGKGCLQAYKEKGTGHVLKNGGGEKGKGMGDDPHVRLLCEKKRKLSFSKCCREAKNQRGGKKMEQRIRDLPLQHHKRIILKKERSGIRSGENTKGEKRGVLGVQISARSFPRKGMVGEHNRLPCGHIFTRMKQGTHNWKQRVGGVGGCWGGGGVGERGPCLVVRVITTRYQGKLRKTRITLQRKGDAGILSCSTSRRSVSRKNGGGKPCAFCSMHAHTFDSKGKNRR